MKKSPTKYRNATALLHQQNIHVVSCPVLGNEQGVHPLPGVCIQAAESAGLNPLREGSEAFFLEFEGQIWISISSVSEFTFSGVDEIKLSHKLTYLRKAHLHLKRTAATQMLCPNRFTERRGLWCSLSPERSLCTLLPSSFKILKFSKEYSEKLTSAQLPHLRRFPLQITEGNRLLVKVTGMSKKPPCSETASRDYLVLRSPWEINLPRLKVAFLSVPLLHLVPMW